jgi:hypothetical protein
MMKRGAEDARGTAVSANRGMPFPPEARRTTHLSTQHYTTECAYHVKYRVEIAGGSRP